MPFSNLLSVLFCVFASTSALIMLKVGANKVKNNDIDGLSVAEQFYLYLNVYIIAGLFVYMISAAIWIWMLTKVDISVAYPFISLGFVMTLIFGVDMFGERLSMNKVLVCV